MYLITIDHPFRYETEKLCREFFPQENITVSGNTDFSADAVVTYMNEKEVGVKYLGEEKTFPTDENTPDSEKERLMAVAMYEVLGEKTGIRPEWGILTGIRPSKVMTNKINELGVKNAEDYFRNKLLVSEKKTFLAKEVSRREEKIISQSGRNSFSLYISIPFCPTRCAYCSFISHSAESAKALIPEYIEKLVREIEITGKTARDANLKLETVYYGGGTPTVLEAPQLERILKAVSDNFDLSAVSEYTVEAGRPDTVTADKLSALKNGGVTRISINPQTFNDGVLEKIGRKHTSQQTLDSFFLARKLGFDFINMDLIAGLPGDTAESFLHTLSVIDELSPENITVHTLSIKRSSFMGKGFAERESAFLAAGMLEDAQKKFWGRYFPYYMYRQSKTLGNLENVGWCKEGYEGRYNIFMMEECHSILSCGAGAVTKLKAPDENHIERIFNFKYPFEYISRYDELIARKDRISQFYNTYNI